MEDTVVERIFKAKLWNPVNGQQNSGDCFHSQSECQDQFDEFDDPADCVLSQRFLQVNPALKADFFAEQDQDGDSERHQPDAAALDQHQQDHFAEAGEDSARIKDAESRHCRGRCGGEQGVGPGNWLRGCGGQFQ